MMPPTKPFLHFQHIIETLGHIKGPSFQLFVSCCCTYLFIWTCRASDSNWSPAETQTYKLACGILLLKFLTSTTKPCEIGRATQTIAKMRAAVRSMLQASNKFLVRCGRGLRDHMTSYKGTRCKVQV